MNILFYSYDGFNPEQGGIERVSNNLAKGFIQAGYQVFFVALLAHNYVPIVEQLVLEDKKDICSQKNQKHFISFVASHNIDIIICQQCYDDDFTRLAFLVKKATSVKLLYSLHASPDYMSRLIEDTSMPFLPSQLTISKHYRRILRTIFKKQKQSTRNEKVGMQIKRLHEMGDGVVLLSKQYIQLACEMAGINSTKNFYGIGNPNTYQEDEINSVDKENTLLFVGRLSHEKRPERALVLWQKIQHLFPNWNLKIVGAGHVEADLKILHKKFKLERCNFEGQQNPKPFYEKAKILLVTSDIEGFGVVITEGMQHGVVPVVFNCYKALMDIIDENKSGISVEPYNLDEFQQKLISLIKDEEKMILMAAACKISVKKFDTELIVKGWKNIFSNLGLNI